MISSEPIGRGESYYAKIWSKNLCNPSAIKFKLSWIFARQFLKLYDIIWLASRCLKQMVVFIKENNVNGLENPKYRG